MALWGTLVNALAILVGGAVGLRLPPLGVGIRTTVMQGMGLALLVLGAQMALKTENVILVIGSLVAGGILGEWAGIEARLGRLGQLLEARFGKGGANPIAAGFVTTTLIYCVGAMAILGSIEGGMRHNHEILYTKSMLDGFSAVIFASTLGVGVLFSAIPVFLYQGAIAVASAFFARGLDIQSMNGVIREVTSVGGVLIIGIGLNILELKKINVANMLPAVVVAACAAAIFIK